MVANITALVVVVFIRSWVKRSYALAAYSRSL